MTWNNWKNKCFLLFLMSGSGWNTDPVSGTEGHEGVTKLTCWRPVSLLLHGPASARWAELPRSDLPLQADGSLPHWPVVRVENKQTNKHQKRAEPELFCRVSLWRPVRLRGWGCRWCGSVLRASTRQAGGGRGLFIFRSCTSSGPHDPLQHHNTHTQPSPFIQDPRSAGSLGSDPCSAGSSSPLPGPRSAVSRRAVRRSGGTSELGKWRRGRVSDVLPLCWSYQSASSLFTAPPPAQLNTLTCSGS